MPAIEYSVSSRHLLRRLISQISYKARGGFFNLLMVVMPATPKIRVLDGSVTPDQSFPEFNFLEQGYPYKNRITATSFEEQYKHSLFRITSNLIIYNKKESYK